MRYTAAMRTRVAFSLLLLFVTALVASPTLAQAPAQAPAFAPGDPLPFDPAVTVGTLPNGLRYYIRKNARPEKRVALQLAVKAGSVDETDNQQGCGQASTCFAYDSLVHFEQCAWRQYQCRDPQTSTGCREKTELFPQCCWQKTCQWKIIYDRVGALPIA